MPGTNSFLNYGYAILRSSTARAVVASGLHPGLGIKHKAAGNPMRLVDDLMEPFRPIVDLTVYQLIKDNSELDSSTKKALAHVLYKDVLFKDGISPVQTAIQRLATSLAGLYLGKNKNLDLPVTTLSSKK